MLAEHVIQMKISTATPSALSSIAQGQRGRLEQMVRLARRVRQALTEQLEQQEHKDQQVLMVQLEQPDHKA